jgi:diguanylate cyclase (GGDEF)-like protein
MMEASVDQGHIRILMVEDDPVDARFIQHQLDTYMPGQYRFTHVTRVSDALDALASGDFRVVLLDLNLPDMQGPQTFSTLSEAAPNIPLIVIAGLTDRSLALDLVRMGAQDYLVKDELSGGLLGRAVHYAMARKEIERKLEDAAHFDALTGLPNRAMFNNRLDRAIARASRRGSRVSLLFMDLDRFKAVNDTMGHAAGDFLLAQLGQRFKAEVRRSDTVARMGGDEFTVIIEDAEDLSTVFHIANKLLHLFDEPFCIEGQDVFVGTSIGIASCSDGECNADTLLSQADDAMYQAKDCGGNRYWLYRELPEAAVEREEEVPSPVAGSAAPEPAPETHSSDVADVLLVDDNPVDRRLITEAFREVRMRHRLRVVTDGRKALSCLQRQDGSQAHRIPKLILLDLNVPGFDCFDILRQIRAEPRLSRVPVIMLSSSSDTATIDRAYDLGVDAFVTKPASLQRSVQVIDTLVRYWLDVVRPAHGG